METYFTVSVVYPNFLIHGECQISQIAIQNFQCLGVEEYSYEESEVDELLGERSYSGGDLTPEIFEEVEIDASKRANPIVNFYFGEKEASQNFKNWMTSLDLRIDVAESEKPVADWNAYWRKHYDTIELTHDYKIIPSWKKAANESEIDKNIYIYPGMGFGTGNHETTYLCLMAMLEHSVSLNDVLDFGCGSGILGIGALRVKPDAKIDFYDIDEDALKNCIENIKLNDFNPDNYPCLMPGERGRLGHYDLVFANILKHVLIEEKTALLGYLKPSAHLILSGILSEQSKEVINEFEQIGLKLVQEYKKGDWVALLMKKETA